MTEIILKENEFVVKLDCEPMEFFKNGGNIQIINPHKSGQYDDMSLVIIRETLGFLANNPLKEQ